MNELIDTPSLIRRTVRKIGTYAAAVRGITQGSGPVTYADLMTLTDAAFAAGSADTELLTLINSLVVEGQIERVTAIMGQVVPRAVQPRARTLRPP